MENLLGQQAPATVIACTRKESGGHPQVDGRRPHWRHLHGSRETDGQMGAGAQRPRRPKSHGSERPGAQRPRSAKAAEPGSDLMATCSTRGTRPLPSLPAPPECLASITGDNAVEDWGRMAAKGTAQRSGDPGAIFVFERNLFELLAPPAQELRHFAPPTQESRQFAMTCGMPRRAIANFQIDISRLSILMGWGWDRSVLVRRVVRWRTQRCSGCRLFAERPRGQGARWARCFLSFISL